MRVKRLHIIQYALVDLFDTLDPEHVRVDTDQAARPGRLRPVGH